MAQQKFKVDGGFESLGDAEIIGTLDMSNYAVVNLGAPTTDTGAATNSWIQAQILTQIGTYDNAPEGWQPGDQIGVEPVTLPDGTITVNRYWPDESSIYRTMGTFSPTYDNTLDQEVWAEATITTDGTYNYITLEFYFYNNVWEGTETIFDGFIFSGFSTIANVIGTTVVTDTNNFVAGNKAVITTDEDKVKINMLAGAIEVGSITLRVDFAEAQASDPYWDNVVFLMHMDGTNGSSTFIDEKGHTLNPVGNPTISTDTSVFGGGSGAFGTNNYITSPWTPEINFGVNDFTVEMWIRFTSMPASNSWPSSYASHAVPFSFGNYSSVQSSGLVIGHTSIGWNSNDTWLATGAHGMTIGNWYHIAVSRSSGTMYTFVNGTMVGNNVNTIDYTYGASTITFGNETTNAGGWLNGNMDDVRITNGVARYTENFTPPTAAFPDTL